MNESHDLEFGFDPADTELARRLGAAAPAPGDADAVLAGMRPRLTRARRRRRTGAIAIGAASLALFAGVAFAATDGSNGAKVRVPPADRSTPITTVTEPSPTTSTTSTTTTTVSTNPPVTPTTIDDKGGDSGNSGSGSGSSGSGSSGSGTSGSGSSGSGSANRVRTTEGAPNLSAGSGVFVTSPASSHPAHPTKGTAHGSIPQTVEPRAASA